MGIVRRAPVSKSRSEKHGADHQVCLIDVPAGGVCLGNNLGKAETLTTEHGNHVCGVTLVKNTRV